MPIDIVPDEGMRGVVGDIVPSNKTASPESHFATPKKTTEIPNDYVVFTAAGITEEQIDANDPDQIVEWVGGEAVQGSPLKRQVKRDQAAHMPIKIQLLQKYGGQEAAKINVWVIWSEMNVDDYQNVAFSNYEADAFEPAGAKYGGIQMASQQHWRFRFAIKPDNMVSDVIDRPDLSGESSTPAPGTGKKHILETIRDGDHASFKWDVSRRVEFEILNPNSVPKNKFPNLYIFRNQPKGRDLAVSYPVNPVEGNDDPGGDFWRDEDDNPYQALTENGLSHAKGEISSFDGPIFAFPATMGVSGATVAQVANFQEFARVELLSGRTINGAVTWFRISDYFEWHHVMGATYGEIPNSDDLFQWGDSGSTFGRGRFSIPEEEE